MLDQNSPTWQNNDQADNNPNTNPNAKTIVEDNLFGKKKSLGGGAIGPAAAANTAASKKVGC